MLKKLLVKTVNEIRKKFNMFLLLVELDQRMMILHQNQYLKLLKLKYCYHPEAYQILENYYEKGKFNIGRKKWPKFLRTASLIYNPSSAAPGFFIKNVYCLARRSINT